MDEKTKVYIRVQSSHSKRQDRAANTRDILHNSETDVRCKLNSYSKLELKLIANRKIAFSGAPHPSNVYPAIDIAYEII